MFNGRTLCAVFHPRWWKVYVLLLILSFIVRVFFPVNVEHGPMGAETDDLPPMQYVTLPAMDRHGPVGQKTIRLAYYDIKPEPEGDDVNRPPVILLHGTPGTADNWTRFWPGLAKAGYRVLAPDLPGNGRSTIYAPDYSFAGHARTVLALLDELDIPRAHVVGWSSGGGVALYMADFAPQRLASLTMLAAIGDQHNEGSGNYYFEHFKYGAGLILLVAGGEAVPHFGLLGPISFRYVSMKTFWDSDQRPLARVMADLEIPTLILHGRHDFLVADWAAEKHHALIPGSRLVMLDASHFIPFLQVEQAQKYLLPFLDRHDRPGVAPVGGEVILAPRPAPLLGRWDEIIRNKLINLTFPGQLLLVLILVLLNRWLALPLLALMVPHNYVDFAVALLGLLLVRFIQLMYSRFRSSPVVFSDDMPQTGKRGSFAAGRYAAFASLRQMRNSPDINLRSPLFLAAFIIFTMLESTLLLIISVVITGALFTFRHEGLGIWAIVLSVVPAAAAILLLHLLTTAPGRELLFHREKSADLTHHGG